MTTEELQQTSRSADRWGIVLSGGNTLELGDPNRRRADYLPKQYVKFGDCSILEHTLRGSGKLISANKLLVVITGEHRQFNEVRRQIASRPNDCVIVQSEDKDTGPALLLALTHVHKRAPDAIVAVFPSTYFIPEDDLFIQQIERAFTIVEADGARLLLLGLEPREENAGYGYILPGGKMDISDSGRTVEMFVQKPATAAAKKLIREGALWNTLVLVGRCESLLQAIQRAQPDLYRSFESIRAAVGTRDEAAVIQRVYYKLPPVNFAKKVLETLSFTDRQSLRVLPVRGITWKVRRTRGTLPKVLHPIHARPATNPEESVPPASAEKPLASKGPSNL